MEWQQKDDKGNPTGYVVTTDPNKVDLDRLHYFLSKQAYWSLGIPKDVVIKAVRGSIIFAILDPNGRLVGFGRVISDQATFGYLADVFVDPNVRKQKLAQFMLKCVLDHPGLQNLRRFVLYTRDAHSLYQKFGWKLESTPERVMVINNPQSYAQPQTTTTTTTTTTSKL